MNAWKKITVTLAWMEADVVDLNNIVLLRTITDAMLPTTKVAMLTNDTVTVNSADEIGQSIVVIGTNTDTSAPINPTKATRSEKPVWTRLNYKGIHHDNRRLLEHRAKNCECEVCYREIYKLPPAESQREYVAAVKSKKAEREIKKAKKKAQKDVKVGRQRSIDVFFGQMGKSP